VPGQRWTPPPSFGGSHAGSPPCHRRKPGGTISWNAGTQQVTVKARGLTIVLTIGKSVATVNGKALAIDPKNAKVVPILTSGRTMLPLRFVAENLGLQVDWNAETRTVTLSWDS